MLTDPVGYTSAVFFVNAVGKRRLLLRVYGNGVDQIIDRENELIWLARLSHLNIVPSLLGVFGNGRFEEYLPSTTLTHCDIRVPEKSKKIASCLRELHDIVVVHPFDASKNKLEIWSNINKWHSVVMSVLPSLLQKGGEWGKVLNVFNLERLPFEIAQCKQILEEAGSPVVFAHNDVSC